MKKEFKNKTLVLISLFLALELILFIALDFGGIGPIFKILVLVMVAILIPSFFQDLRDDLGRGLYILLLPLLFYGIVTMFAPAYGTLEVVYANETFLNLSIFDKLVNLFGIVGILLLGYVIRKSGVFSAKHVYIVVLAGLAAPILISLFATLVNYGFFHTIIYRGQVNFYGGAPYRIVDQASYLYGFKILTIDIDFLLSGAVIIASAGLGLLFANKETSKLEIISLSIISAIGLLTIILTGAFITLLFLLPAIVFGLIVRFNLLKKIKKPFYYTLAALFGLGVLVFVITAFNLFGIQEIFSSNPVTRKLFLNGYFLRFYHVLVEALSLRNIMGDFRNSISGVDIFPTGNFVFDSMWLDGLLGSAVLLTFIVIFVINLIRYFGHESDNKLLKVTLMSVLMTMFFRFMLFYPFRQLMFKEHQANNMFPLISSPYFLITIFFAGYVFTSKGVEEVESVPIEVESTLTEVESAPTKEEVSNEEN